MLSSLKEEIKKFGEDYVVRAVNSVLDQYVQHAIISGIIIIDPNEIKIETLLKLAKKEIYKGVIHGKKDNSESKG